MRELNNQECSMCSEELKKNPLTLKAVHVSFDFAQQLHFPSSPQQVGTLYFLTPRKCQLFSVCFEAKAEQVNYLIDENVTTLFQELHQHQHTFPSARRICHLCSGACIFYCPLLGGIFLAALIKQDLLCTNYKMPQTDLVL